MRSTISLWYEIESLFTEVGKECTEARAAELVARKRAEFTGPLDSLGAPAPTSMTVEDTSNTPRFPGALELANDPAFQARSRGGANPVKLRATLRKLLDGLKGKLSEVLNEREVYYTLFPIVIFCDELLYDVTEGAKRFGPIRDEMQRDVEEDERLQWVPLQRELYEIENGGEVFYALIDSLVRKEDTEPLVFQVFYYCLNDGFQGIHLNDPHIREEYKSKLAARIPVEKPEAPGPLKLSGDSAIRLVNFPVRYYVLAVASVIVVFVALRFLSEHMVTGAH
ncbi:MAG: DotU family type IV/VI secretion system protein [Myxococcales bacterium]|nr:DotU family type IV/VI secretion system protein [Myxococcales bacterium]MDD9969228.1 DotU family type IV/VI secretion system protein [Myxococcales bacterium]